MSRHEDSLPEDLEALLQHERQVPAAAPGAAEQVAAALKLSIAAGVAPALGPTGAKLAVSKLVLLGTAPLLLGGLLVAFVTLKPAPVVTHEHESALVPLVPPPAQPAQGEPPDLAAPMPPAPPGSSGAAVAPGLPTTAAQLRPASPRPPPPVPEVAATTSDAATPSTEPVHSQDERVKLEACRAAMVQRRWDEALALLDAHARQFPHGDFSEERESLTIIAMDARGLQVEARVRAERFSQTWPDSIFLPAIAAALRLSPTDSASSPQEP